MAVVNRNGRATKLSSGSKSCYTGIYNNNIRVLSFLLGLWISQTRDVHMAFYERAQFSINYITLNC